MQIGFNPRAPCGARHIVSWKTLGKSTFQSTRPVWGATVFPEALPSPNKFQSTRPVWGATRQIAQRDDTVRVSIHAPRVGRDSCYLPRPPPWARFNPRAPCGARPYTAPRSRGRVRVSIHAPRVGRDHNVLPLSTHFLVSIHAPRVGRDIGFLPRRSRQCRFNPRAPCGARQQQRYAPRVPVAFQSTRPVWGATIASGVYLRAIQFQSTRPVWGATPSNSISRSVKKFQSTRPVWGATVCGSATDTATIVSIHAPRVGRDYNTNNPFEIARVSIHAPRVGRD